MKAGRTLNELAAEIQRQQETKHDYVADTRKLQMQVDPIQDNPVLQIVGTGMYPIRSIAHQQIASRLNISKVYYDRMLMESPGLLVNNVNHWFDAKPEKRMVRTLDGECRAFLSNRFRPLDNHDLAEAVLPIMFERSDCQVESCEITETKLYIKAIWGNVSGEVKVGEVVKSGVMVSNSEVGQGSLSVQPLVFVLRCLNGLIIPDYGIKKYHVGRNRRDNSEPYELYSDETLAIDDMAVFAKLGDVVRATVTNFPALLEKMSSTTHQPINDPVKTVELAQEKFQFSDTESGSILKGLAEGGDMTRWGLIQAITGASQDVLDYDRATELESLGGQVLELPKSEWEALAAVA